MFSFWYGFARIQKHKFEIDFAADGMKTEIKIILLCAVEMLNTATIDRIKTFHECVLFLSVRIIGLKN